MIVIYFVILQTPCGVSPINARIMKWYGDGMGFQSLETTMMMAGGR